MKSATVTGETPKPVPLVSALAVELFASTMPDCRSRAARQPTCQPKAAVTCGEWCRVAGVTRGGERAVWSVVVVAVRRVAMSGPRGSSPRLTRVRLLALGRSPLHSQSPLRTQRRARYG